MSLYITIQKLLISVFPVSKMFLFVKNNKMRFGCYWIDFFNPFTTFSLLKMLTIFFKKGLTSDSIAIFLSFNSLLLKVWSSSSSEVVEFVGLRLVGLIGEIFLVTTNGVLWGRISTTLVGAISILKKECF